MTSNLTYPGIILGKWPGWYLAVSLVVKPYAAFSCEVVGDWLNGIMEPDGF